MVVVRAICALVSVEVIGVCLFASYKTVETAPAFAIAIVIPLMLAGVGMGVIGLWVAQDQGNFR